MRHKSIWCGGAVLLLLAACAADPATDSAAGAAGESPGGPAGEQSVQYMVPRRNVAALAGPSSWTGRIPCADCEVIETTVTLHPDGEFRSRGVYRGARGTGDTVFTDFGRWSHRDNGTRVSVRGSANIPGQFAVAPEGALRMLDPSGNEIASPLNYTLTAVEPAVAITHPTRLVGAFTLGAEGATFTECGSGVQHPVATTGDYAATAAAYRSAGVAAGSPVPVRVRAHVEEAATDAAARVVVIDSLDRIDREAGCAAIAFPRELADGPWRLALLGDATGPLAPPAAGDAEFGWELATGRIAGNAGCNRMTGPATLRGTLLEAGALALTRRMCDDAAMRVERQLVALLGAPLALRLDADTLVWQQGPAEVARFVRAP